MSIMRRWKVGGRTLLRMCSSVAGTASLDSIKWSLTDEVQPIAKPISDLLLKTILSSDEMTTEEDVLKRVPLMAAQAIRSYPGGLLKYAADHYADKVVVRGSTLVPKVKRVVSTAPPPSNAAPPPPPPPLSSRQASASNNPFGAQGSPSARGYRTPPEVLDVLIHYIPTFWVNSRIIFDSFPPEVREMVSHGAVSFPMFLKKYRFYFDQRTNHNQTEVRLRADLTHPKRGAADLKHSSGMSSSDAHQNLVLAGSESSAASRKPPRNSEANLILGLVSKLSNGANYTPLPQVLPEISLYVQKHPSFDPKMGIIGVLEKYPEYFQIVDGKLRVRPFLSAPNSIDDLDLSSSILPETYMKLLQRIPEAPENVNQFSERAVDVAELITVLSPTERSTIREKCKSVARFLRLHGRDLVVSQDNARVRRFVPELEPCADHLIETRLKADSISPNDPILAIPSQMEDSTADWAVKEMYDSLPLMQACEMNDLLQLVPSAVRNALPNDAKELMAALMKYPDHFLCWLYPDDESIVVVQRAKLVTPPISDEDLLRIVMPLVPQGGIDCDKLMRRVPLPLQRHFYKKGIKGALEGVKEYLLVAGTKVLRIA